MVTSSQPEQRVALSKALHAAVFRWGPKPLCVQAKTDWHLIYKASCETESQFSPH